MMAKKQKLAIIDAHALIHRAYHALPPMNAPDGTPTNAAYGFVTMLLKMFQTVKPTHVVAAFDEKGKTFRHEKFEDYKGTRKAPDDELVVQFEIVRELVAAFGIPILSQKGYEADDVIGTICEQLQDKIDTIIVTGDMDTLQLVDDDTRVFTLRKGMTDTVLYDEQMVREKYGFGPEHVTDYKGLAGDSSDNIPGVEGIGEKTAKELVGQYGPIEEIFKHVEELPTRAKNRLEGKKDEAEFSKDLATIARDAPVQFDLAASEVGGFEKLEDTLLKYGFKSVVGRLPKEFMSQKSLLGDVSDDASRQARSKPDNYFLVQTEAEKDELKKKLKTQKLIAFDTETDGLGARTSPLIGFSCAFRLPPVAQGKASKIEAYYVPVEREDLKEWEGIFGDESIGKTGHNLKYDMTVMRQAGVQVNGVVFDTMLASYLLDSTSRAHSLDALALSELDHACISITELIGSDKKSQISMREVPLEQLVHYAAEDADVSLRLCEVLEPKLKEAGLTRVMDEIEIPLLDVLVHMETGGVGVDVDVLKALGSTAEKELTKLTTKIHDLAGQAFNINSTQQLRVILYEALKLPTEKISRTQSGYSTAASELKKLRGEHEIIGLLEQYRELAKLKNTYLDTLPKLVEDGRIYSTYNQTVAATGRLSSVDPNLQNIPVRTEMGNAIRSAFVAGRGKRLIKADYSQLELRLAAHISQDEKMIQAFRDREDIHRATAAWVMGVESEQVTSEQRRVAKTLNFGVLYGMGAKAFAQAAGVSFEEATSFIGRYREQYKGLEALLQKTTEQAETMGYVETLYGRRRYVPEIQARAPGVRSQAERVAFNFPMQGTEADILKLAMIAVQAETEKNFPNAQLVLSVHDEIVAEVPEGDVEAFVKMMKEKMEGVITLDVPLTVDVEVGKNWRDTGAV